MKYEHINRRSIRLVILFKFSQPRFWRHSPFVCPSYFPNDFYHIKIRDGNGRVFSGIRPSPPLMGRYLILINGFKIF